VEDIASSSSSSSSSDAKDIQSSSMAPSQEGLSTKVFVGNMPFTVTEKEIRKLANDLKITDDMRRIVSISIPQGKKSKSGMGFVFIDFDSVDSAVKASEKINGAVFSGRTINSNVKDLASANAPKKVVTSKARVIDNSIYLANLDVTLTEEEIINMCNDILATPEEQDSGILNKIVSIEKPLEKGTDVPRGFAFIEFGSKALVELACKEFNNLEVLGKLLYCLPMQKQSERKKKILGFNSIEEELYGDELYNIADDQKIW
jgi:RNA recognition motif-containing protein